MLPGVFAIATGALLLSQVGAAFDASFARGALVAIGAWWLLGCGAVAIGRSGRTVTRTGLVASTCVVIAATAATVDAEHDAVAGSARAAPAARIVGPVIALDGDTPCERSGPPAFQSQNGGGHGHRGPVAWSPLRTEERAELGAQIATARVAARRFPTVAAAVAGGYRQVTHHLPCIGAHYIHEEHVLGDGFDPAAPEMLLYDGTAPDAPIVGLSYAVRGADPPRGFAGRNDPWHAHEQLCLVDGIVTGDETVTGERCARLGGALTTMGRLWMSHAWVVPGWESAWGLFSNEHPQLGSAPS